MTSFPAARWAGLALAAWALDFAAMYAWVTFACPRPTLGWITTAVGAAGALAALVGAIRADQTSDDPSEIAAGPRPDSQRGSASRSSSRLPPIR